MANSFWDADTRQSLMIRVHKLTPDAVPAWGTMDARKMLSHITDVCRMASGELPVTSKGGLLRYWPIPDLVIYALPWPHGAPTSPEVIERSVGDWEAGLHAFDVATGQLVDKATVGSLPDHPALGRLTNDQWGALMARHLDHHLTQFKV